MTTTTAETDTIEATQVETDLDLVIGELECDIAGHTATSMRSDPPGTCTIIYCA